MRFLIPILYGAALGFLINKAGYEGALHWAIFFGMLILGLLYGRV